ncbi:predicted protein, partial [Nematostella vectensis]
RLVGGIRPSQGRLEVFYDGRWGTVCNDLWSDTNANVVCKSLGFGESHGLGFMFGAGSGPILMDDVICSGNEASLVDCSHRGWGVEDCEHREDVGVVCNNKLRTRLVAGNIPSEGRVEVLNDGVWGTVCDDLWSMEDAHVVCRSLGFQGARDYKSHAFFGRGTGPIWLDGVRCRGSEESVLECEHRGIGIHMCGHHEDAGVVCITSQ